MRPGGTPEAGSSAARAGDFRLFSHAPARAVGVLTNVPGPRTRMTLAGAEVDGIVGWAPCSGRQAITICIFGYAGEVRFGFGTDRRLIPDPEVLVDALAAEFAAAGR